MNYEAKKRAQQRIEVITEKLGEIRPETEVSLALLRILNTLYVIRDTLKEIVE